MNEHLTGRKITPSTASPPTQNWMLLTSKLGSSNGLNPMAPMTKTNRLASQALVLFAHRINALSRASPHRGAGPISRAALA